MKTSFAMTAVLLVIVAFCCCQAVAQNCRCLTCEDYRNARSPENLRLWSRIRESTSGVRRSVFPTALAAQQVFLDFDSGTDGSIEYTTAIRNEIQSELELIFERFNVAFTQTPPTGEFSTLQFNAGSAGGGLAEDIDFRNLNLSDSAVMNLDGIGLSSDQIAPVSTVVAAHELGHLLGLRHYDMFGPIGDGIFPAFVDSYSPSYNGPTGGFAEAVDHVMVTGAFGIPFDSFVSPSWFSERSATKLTVAEIGIPIAENEANDSLSTAQPIDLQPLSVPNTIVVGENASEFDFAAGAAVVIGSIDDPVGDLDVFSFTAKAGELFNLELISSVVNRLAVNPIDPNVSVLDSAGNPIDYFGVDAFNASEIESEDCSMVDFIIPADGQYFVQVASEPFNEGFYELLVYRFSGLTGDINSDGNVDLLDVSPFVDLLVDGESCPNADVNFDGTVDLFDVSPFVSLLTGG